ncbi:hypothetical protein KX816_18365 [Sphingosinicellaceae bacterium]|nr:hypothetical protein KX816_18365 [Sphingosinicellaceae bacterium]
MNMQMNVLNRAPHHSSLVTQPLAYEDPIGIDDPRDVSVITTARGLCRVALIAAQAATRFAAEGSEHDPMAWMLAPRRLFDGRNALSACREHQPFMRAMLLHGLALGLDADPDDLDDLFSDDAELDMHETPADHCDLGPANGEGTPAGQPDGRPRLYTATIADRTGGALLHAFHASVASSPAEIAARLWARYGTAATGAAITPGFDRTQAFAQALVAPAVADLLEKVDADPVSPVAGGLDLNFEQRMDA